MTMILSFTFYRLLSQMINILTKILIIHLSNSYNLNLISILKYETNEGVIFSHTEEFDVLVKT